MMYRLTNNETVVRLADGAFIPADESNRDWAEYQEWLSNGGLPEPYQGQGPDPSEPTVPNTVSKLGLKRALEELDMWADIKAAIASNPAVQEEWDLAVEIHRNDPMTQFVIDLKQLTGQQVDALILRAHELVQRAQ